MAFKRLDPEDFIVSVDTISSPLWSGNSNTLTTFHSSSAQKLNNSGEYYLSVYNQPIGTNNSETQFDISFADKLGRGTAAYNALSLIHISEPTRPY